MKTLYTVVTQFMNGTVTMTTDIANFTSKELAEKTRDAIIKINENAKFPAYSRVEETRIYESEDEVPILKNLKLYKNGQ